MAGRCADLAHPDRPERLAALAALHASAPPAARRGCDLLLRSDHSFGPFLSACEAVWEARQAGLEVAGIADLLSTGGHGEFIDACAVVGLPAVLGLEIAVEGGVRLLALAITRPADAAAQAELARLRRVHEAHCRALTVRVGERFRATVGAAGPSWGDVVDLTPAGNVDERHVAWAVVGRVRAVAVERSMPAADAWQRVIARPPAGGDGEQFHAVLDHLFQSGGPCHVPAPPEARPTLDAALAICLGLGAVPAAIVPGPTPSGLRSWCDRMETAGVRALAVLPACSSEDLVASAVAEAQRRDWPVVDGSALDGPAPAPLVSRWSLDERFRPAFRAGAEAMLAQQRSAIPSPATNRV
jgi:hypothetical protein